jgi:N-acetylmuramoyl-L-alanine amidase
MRINTKSIDVSHPGTVRRLRATAAPLGVALVLGIAAFAIGMTVASRAAAAPAPVAKPAAVSIATSVPAGFVVVIDAGHQAHADNKLEPIGPGSSTRKASVTGGTSGVVTRAHESVINLRVALRLRNVLTAAGVKVVMVRTSENVDISNSKRAQIANAAHAGIFVRLHCDGSTSRSTHGFLTLVPARNRWTVPIVTSSARAGRDIQSAAVAATHAYSRGITPRSDMAGFNWSRVPSVIVEMGLMTNPAEDRLLSSAAYEQKLAVGIANGILAFARGK